MAQQSGSTAERQHRGAEAPQISGTAQQNDIPVERQVSTAAAQQRGSIAELQHSRAAAKHSYGKGEYDYFRRHIMLKLTR